MRVRAWSLHPKFDGYELNTEIHFADAEVRVVQKSMVFVWMFQLKL